VELVAPGVLRLGPIRRAAEKGRELPDLANVVALGVLAELADDHILNHPPTQRRNGFGTHEVLPSKVM